MVAQTAVLMSPGTFINSSTNAAISGNWDRRVKKKDPEELI